MKYFLSSMDTHGDKGFGVTGEAFLKAADYLNEAEDYKTTIVPQIEMPVFYLYRHSIELFLKSLIMFINEKLEITDGDTHKFTMKKIPNKKKKTFLKGGGKPKVILAVQKENGEIQDIYQSDTDKLKPLLKSLKEVSSYLHGIHIMVRMTLCGGW